MATRYPWPRRDKELIALHTRGLSWAAIGQKMFLSKYAVKERAQVLGLGSKDDRSAEPPRRLRPGEPTLPPLPSLQMPMFSARDYEDDDDV